MKYFLTCWHDGLGYLNLKKILKKNISIYEKFITYLKLIYSVSSIKGIQISQNLKKNKYENLVISHLNRSNYTSKNYFDKHFSLNTNNTKSTIWVFITSSQFNEREKVINNIVLFKKYTEVAMKKYFLFLNSYLNILCYLSLYLQ